MAAAVKRSTARVRAAVSRVVSTASESSRAKSSSLSTLPITSSDSDFLCLGSIFFPFGGYDGSTNRAQKYPKAHRGSPFIIRPGDDLRRLSICLSGLFSIRRPDCAHLVYQPL